MLTAVQCPEATQVAGSRKWQELGRQVRKGEKSIRILAPMSVTGRDETESSCLGGAPRDRRNSSNSG